MNCHMLCTAPPTCMCAHTHDPLWWRSGAGLFPPVSQDGLPWGEELNCFLCLGFCPLSGRIPPSFYKGNKDRLHIEENFGEREQTRWWHPRAQGIFLVLVKSHHQPRRMCTLGLGRYLFPFQSQTRKKKEGARCIVVWGVLGPCLSPHSI